MLTNPGALISLALGQESENCSSQAQQPRNDVQGEREAKLKITARVIVKIVNQTYRGRQMRRWMGVRVGGTALCTTSELTSIYSSRQQSKEGGHAKGACGRQKLLHECQGAASQACQDGHDGKGAGGLETRVVIIANVVIVHYEP